MTNPTESKFWVLLSPAGVASDGPRGHTSAERCRPIGERAAQQRDPSLGGYGLRIGRGENGPEMKTLAVTIRSPVPPRAMRVHNHVNGNPHTNPLASATKGWRKYRSGYAWWSISVNASVDTAHAVTAPGNASVRSRPQTCRGRTSGSSMAIASAAKYTGTITVQPTPHRLSRSTNNSDFASG
jgi:hypothetical protein